MQTLEAENKLDILKSRTRVDLSLNDLRILLGCFNAVAYQEKVDDESYLDPDAIDLRNKLESLYEKMLKRRGI